MGKVVKDTSNLGYLGKAFQIKTIWQLLIDNKFCDNIIEHLQSNFYDDDTYKRIIIEIKNYHEKYEKSPSLGNRSIYEIISEKVNDEIEKETIIAILDKIVTHNKKVKRGLIVDDGDVVQKQIWLFVKQQHYKNLGQFIIKNVTEGNLEIVSEIEEKFEVINKIGVDEDLVEDIFDDIDDTLEDDYRNTISTGLGKDVDDLMGGGLGNGEMGFILAPLGTGKTTALTKIANHAFNQGKNVLQIFFEDTKKQIKRKHYTLWSGIPQSKIGENVNIVKESVKAHQTKSEGKLKLLKLPQEDKITIPFIKNWILTYQKLYNIKFDIIVLDYIDCVESHAKSSKSDDLSNELKVVKAFEAMLADLDIPGWSAIQGNRQSINSEFVETHQMGGNIKRAQKTHFLMSIARNDEQKREGRANAKILKSRFGSDGVSFNECLFNNDSLEIDLKANNTINRVELAISDNSYYNRTEQNNIENLEDVNLENKKNILLDD